MPLSATITIRAGRTALRWRVLALSSGSSRRQQRPRRVRWARPSALRSPPVGHSPWCRSRVRDTCHGACTESGDEGPARSYRRRWRRWRLKEASPRGARWKHRGSAATDLAAWRSSYALRRSRRKADHGGLDCGSMAPKAFAKVPMTKHDTHVAARAACQRVWTGMHADELSASNLRLAVCHTLAW